MRAGYGRTASSSPRGGASAVNSSSKHPASTGARKPVLPRILAPDQVGGRVGPTNRRIWLRRVRNPFRHGGPSWADVTVERVLLGGMRLSVAAAALAAAAVVTCSACGSDQHPKSSRSVPTPTTQI